MIPVTEGPLTECLLQLNFRPYSQIRPSGLAIWFLIFGLLVFNYLAFRIRHNGPTSLRFGFRMAVFSYFHQNNGPVFEMQKQDGIQNHSKTEQKLKNIRQFKSKLKKQAQSLKMVLTGLLDSRQKWERFQIVIYDLMFVDFNQIIVQPRPVQPTARLHFFAQLDILIWTPRLLQKQTRSRSQPP